MRAFILALTLGGAGVSAQTPEDPKLTTLTIDVGGVVLREVWDLNGSTESLAGAAAGIDRQVWRGVALRGEALALHVDQAGGNAWLRGFTVGTRTRWRTRQVRPFVDIAVGLSNATLPVPPTGTRVNYLAVIGAGIERRLGSVVLAVTGRWLHASNNGREGRHRNPDTQSLGALVSVGWEH
jgi:hypothetical protein